MMADRKRHPIRGFFGGLIFGLGVSILLITTAVLLFGKLTPLIVLVAGIALGLVVGIVGPTRRKVAVAARG
jgi:uncharacterized membrane protein SpoIIM required for sporulation